MSAVRVLPGFQTPQTAWSRRRRALGLFAVAAGVVMWMGLGVAVLPPQLLAFPALPVIILWLMVFWALPDVDRFPDARITRYFAITMCLFILWPPYLALNLPGVPWITPARAAYFVVIAISMFAIATSSAFRAQLGEILGTDKIVKWSLLLFVITGIVALLASGKLALVGREVNNLLYWPFAFMLAGYAAMKTGNLNKFMKMLIVSTAIIVIIGILEFRVQHILWLRWVGYFNVDPELLERIVDPNNARAGGQKYRTHSTFITSLQMSEYLALTVPFVIYYTARATNIVKQGLLAALVLGILVAIWCTDSRLGMVGFVMTVGVMSFLIAYRAWRDSPRNLLAAGVLYLYPILATAALGVLMASTTARTAILGGGQHASSDEARLVQWRMGWPKIFHMPIGYGPGAGGDALGFVSPSGVLTIDTYYLSLLLDYGVLGFLAFMTFFGRATWLGIRTYLGAKPASEEELAGPAAVAMLNFMVIKSVLSQESNHVYAFAIAGIIVALSIRARNAAGAAADAAVLAR